MYHGLPNYDWKSWLSSLKLRLDNSSNFIHALPPHLSWYIDGTWDSVYKYISSPTFSNCSIANMDFEKFQRECLSNPLLKTYRNSKQKPYTETVGFLLPVTQRLGSWSELKFSQAEGSPASIILQQPKMPEGLGNVGEEEVEGEHGCCF